MHSGLEDEFVFNFLRTRSPEQLISTTEAEEFAAQVDIDESRIAVAERLQHVGRVGVANPNLLQAGGIRPWFFLASGRTGRFAQVIEAASAATSGISHYVLYGDWDALIIVYGSDVEAERFSDHLSMGAFEPPLAFSAESVLLTEGLLPVQLTKEPNLTEADQRLLNASIEDFDLLEVEQSRWKFIESGCLLGTKWRESTHGNAPITAFVGLHLRGRSSLAPAALLAALAGNWVIGPALRDLFQIKSALPYHYLARLACGSFRELDLVTDALSLLRIDNVDLKCTTHIVASSTETLPMYRQPEIPDFNAGPSMTEMTRQTDDVFRSLSSEHQQLFNDLSGSQQLQFLSQYLRLVRAVTDDRLDVESASRLKTAMHVFAHEVLQNSREPNLTAAVTEVAVRVEELARQLLTKISWSVFGRDPGLAQKELKLPSRSISGLSLGKVVSGLRVAATNPRCEKFHSILDSSSINRLDSFAQDRNLWIHGAHSTLSQDRSDEAMRALVLAQENIVWILQQTEVVEGDGHIPTVVIAINRPDFFISHASEDKSSVARPLSDLLTSKNFTVWLDETELTVGDSLRESIDSAISTCHFGIVILSKAFFAKNWPQQELNALFARQMHGRKVILPVWHDVDHSVLLKYSPLLADRLAANTLDGLDLVATQIAAAFKASQAAEPKMEAK